MKYAKLNAAVTPNPHRQPSCTTKYATSGTPMTFENFAAASKIDVASARSLRGNQYPVPFELTGNAGAPPTPSSVRAANPPAYPPAHAVIVDAMPHKKV